MIKTNFCNDKGRINPCRSLHLIRRNVGRRNIVSWGGKRDGVGVVLVLSGKRMESEAGDGLDTYPRMGNQLDCIVK